MTKETHPSPKKTTSINTEALKNQPANKTPNSNTEKQADTTTKVRTKDILVEGNPIVTIKGKEYEIKTPLFNVSGFGTFTNKEAAINKKLLNALLEMGSSVLKEVF